MGPREPVSIPPPGQWCPRPPDAETWGGDSLTGFGIVLWPLNVNRIICMYKSSL